MARILRYGVLGSLAMCIIAFCFFMCPFVHAGAEPPWLEVHSAHFTVITDAGDRKGREVALRFEQMRSVFALVLTKERLNQSVPLTILAFRNDKSYYQLAPLHQGQPIGVPGFFLPGEDQDFIVLNLSEEEPWRAVAHDFAAMLLNFNYPPAQGWFDEGLAEYFSSIRLDNRQVELGGDPELRPSLNEDLLGNQREAHPSKSLVELLGAQVWLPLPDLFSMKHDPSALNQGTHHTLYYAESWIVMHYLLHEKKLPETGAYFDLVLNQHVSVEEAIQKAYGMSSAQLEKAVKDYFHSQSALLTALDSARQVNPGAAASPANSVEPGQSFRFPAPLGPDDVAITTKGLAEAEERALYAEVAIRIPERRDGGLQQLKALATAPTAADKKFEAKKQERRPSEDPDQLPTNAVGSPLAHRILAWDHIQHGEFDEATTDLADATALDPRDMWLRYYLSVLKYRVAQAKHADMQGLPNMMIDLRAVLDWYPELAGAYDLLGVARNEGGSTLAAMQAERAAIGLSPRNELYIYHLAQIYVASKKWEASQVLLDRLKASSNPQIVTLAGDLLERAGTERKYGIPIGAGSMPQAKLAPQKSPFDVLEEDAAKREAAEKASSSAGPAEKRPTKFVNGRLLAVDCSNTPIAVLTVSAGGSTLNLRASDFRSLVLIGAQEFSCDWRDRQVTANYNPVGAKGGELVSLEVH
jgi:tetratricopeptide (TPR) repeat protein